MKRSLESDKIKYRVVSKKAKSTKKIAM